ncbi:MAG TPA: hypothetical protein VFC19_36525 [Candidatus Limnocylindrales bacterium]|nr:hypothetical protein [Candidatus Limnocylindrales bacterium]
MLFSDVPLVQAAEYTMPTLPFSLSPSQLALIFRHLGTAPFYRYLLVARSLIKPVALAIHPEVDGVRGDSVLADTFGQCLLEKSLPWLEDKAWDEQHSDESISITLASLAKDEVTGKDALARLLVSALPYLEIAARRGCHGDLGSAAELFIRARSATGRISVVTRYRLEEGLRSTLAGMPSEYAVLLHGWAERQLNVLA